jgi:hypothetical protein
VAQEQADQLLRAEAGPAAAHFRQALRRLLERGSIAVAFLARFAARAREAHDILFSEHG